MVKKMNDGGVMYKVKLTEGSSVDPERNKIQHKDIHNEL